MNIRFNLFVVENSLLMSGHHLVINITCPVTLKAGINLEERQRSYDSKRIYLRLKERVINKFYYSKECVYITLNAQ